MVILGFTGLGSVMVHTKRATRFNAEAPHPGRGGARRLRRLVRGCRCRGHDRVRGQHDRHRHRDVLRDSRGEELRVTGARRAAAVIAAAALSWAGRAEAQSGTIVGRTRVAGTELAVGYAIVSITPGDRELFSDADGRFVI